MCIKLKDLSLNKRIGQMERPPLPDDTPEKIVKESNAPPCFYFNKKDENSCIFTYSWIYILKMYEVTRNTEENSVNIKKIHEFILDPMTKYIAGFSFINENFLLFEFEDNKENPEDVYKPNLVVYSEKNSQLYKTKIKNSLITSNFKGLHYRTSTIAYDENGSESILYNPETVYKIFNVANKVLPIKLKEHVLHLLSQRRVDECIEFVENYKTNIQPEVIKKVRGAHLDLLLKEKKFKEAADLLPKYWAADIQQWEHWIRRFKQKKSLGFISSLIPVGNPIKLTGDTYFFVIKDFLEHKDFGNLILCVEIFKPHLLNYDKVYDLLNETFQDNTEVIKNSLFFKTFLRISEYTNNKMGIYLMLLKLSNPRVFDIIYDKDIQVEPEHVVELLNISPSNTVQVYL